MGRGGRGKGGEGVGTGGVKEARGEEGEYRRRLSWSRRGRTVREEDVVGVECLWWCGGVVMWYWWCLV